MSAPSKNAPMKPEKGKDAPVQNGTAPASSLDWNAVQVAESAKPITRLTKNSVDLAATPFPALYARSKTTGQPIVFGPLPNHDAVTTAVNLIRKSANAVNGGARFLVGDKVTTPDGKADVKPNVKGLSVKFQATDKKSFTPGKPRRPRPVKGQSEDEYKKVLSHFLAEATKWNDTHPDDLVALTPNKSGK